MNYEDFLKQKLIRHEPTGIDREIVNSTAFDWQKATTKWALKQGKAALFEDCGLGKTGQQLMWANEVVKETGKPVLILAPLAVGEQTVREGVKFGIKVTPCRSQIDVVNGVNITNYEMLSHFDASVFGGVVLDESSILKSYMGKTKRLICEAFKDTPYRLACTATPAPNDLMELLNHAEFLGIMRSSEALSVWFIADQTESGKYKLKGHAEKDFWEWVSSWAVCVEKPSDIGFSDDGYILPGLNEQDITIEISEFSEEFTGSFFRNIDLSATGFYAEKSRTSKLRAKKCAEIAASSDEQYMIWCDTNQEADDLKRCIPEAEEIRGSDKPEVKEKAAIDFVEGRTRVMISKPSIFGYGLNFQNCRNCVFCGLDYSFESYYQAVRRFYRFGQAGEVNVYRVIGSTEKNILEVINAKQKQKDRMGKSMAQAIKEHQTNNIRGKRFTLDLNPQIITVPNWIRSEIA